MFVAAIAHHFIFSFRDYRPPRYYKKLEKKDIRAAVYDSMIPRDMAYDTRKIIDQSKVEIRESVREIERTVQTAEHLVVTHVVHPIQQILPLPLARRHTPSNPEAVNTQGAAASSGGAVLLTESQGGQGEVTNPMMRAAASNKAPQEVKRTEAKKDFFAADFPVEDTSNFGGTHCV